MLNTIIDILEKILKQLTLIAQGANRENLPACPSMELPDPALHEPDPDTLHGAKYAEERIGVVDRTIYRLTQRGMLPIHSYVLGMRQFRRSDIERCRRYYRGE